MLQGEPFFDEGGEPSVALQEALKFLGMNAQSMKAAEQATEMLNRHQLFKPWNINLQTEQGERKIAGLCQIDENALNALSAADLLIIPTQAEYFSAYALRNMMVPSAASARKEIPILPIESW